MAALTPANAGTIHVTRDAWSFGAGVKVEASGRKIDRIAAACQPLARRDYSAGV
jgi:hypothetical protein